MFQVFKELLHSGDFFLNVYVHEIKVLNTRSCLRGALISVPTSSYSQGRNNLPSMQDAAAKQLREAEGCPPALPLSRRGGPANLHGEEMLGNHSSPSVAQSCPKGPSHRAAAPSKAAPELCEHNHSTFRNSPAKRGNVFPPNIHTQSPFLLGENICREWG